MKITAQTTLGRILLALRAGQMEAGEIIERLPATSAAAISELTRLGFIERAGPGNTGYFRLTTAGRRACPARRAAKETA